MSRLSPRLIRAQEACFEHAVWCLPMNRTRHRSRPLTGVCRLPLGSALARRRNVYLALRSRCGGDLTLLEEFHNRVRDVAWAGQGCVRCAYGSTGARCAHLGTAPLVERAVQVHRQLTLTRQPGCTTPFNPTGRLHTLPCMSISCVRAPFRKPGKPHATVRRPSMYATI